MASLDENVTIVRRVLAERGPDRRLGGGLSA